jgi:hypothetical protein
MNPKIETQEHLPQINTDGHGFFGGAGSPLPADRPGANDGAHGVTRPTLPTVVLHFIRVHLCASVVQFGFSG